MKKSFLLVASLFIVGYLSAQNILMSDGTFTQCDGFFQDSGGGNGGYGNNENFTATICSNNPSVDGSHVNIQFPGLDIAAGDLLCFFDGPDVTAPMLSCHTDYQVPQITIQATAANTSGCLTMTFVSDGSGTAQGWSAAINCVPSCQTIIADLVNSIPEVMPIDTGWIDVCPGDRVFFYGAGIYPQDGLVYNHSDLTSNFEWNFGDGDIGYGPNVSHTYDEPGGYTVQLTITDQLGCYSTNYITQRVRVSGPPGFNLLADLPEEMCVGDTVSLAAIVEGNDSTYTLDITPGDYNFQLEGVRSDSVALPDGTGEVYSTIISFSDFSPGQFLGSANDIVEVCVVMEHSYLRDLVIRLECPDGSEITLHEFGGTTGGQHFLGVPFEADEGIPPVQGTGWEYCWTANATNGTWLEYCNANNPATLPSGDYSSFDSFDNLVGCPLNGEWSINVEDLWGIDNGWIFSWSIAFQESLYPNIETFSPEIDSFSWVDQSSIIYFEPDTIVSAPQNAGTANYVFEVFDGFGCTWDTALNVTVLPVTHPDCYNCGENVNPLNDTLICEGESVQFEVDYFGPTSDEVVFESFPLYAIGNGNHPLNNPYESRITITNVNPTVIVDPNVNMCRVCVDLDTDFDSDIHLYLISPDGQYLELSTGNGGAGDNYTNTCFTVDATTPIQAGSAPFTGDFLPEGNWNDLDGSPINGDWILAVSDAFGVNDFGFLRSWSICFNSENDVTYTWQNDASLSCTNCPDPIVTPTTTTDYFLVVEDSYGCVHKDTVQVALQQQLAGPTIIECISLENGAAEIVWDPLGGSIGYEVSINNGPWIPASEAQSHILTGLANNEVINIQVRGIAPSTLCSVEITDYSCTYVQPCTLVGNLIDVTGTTCYETADGAVDVSAFDGINPITFSIDGSPFQSSGSYPGLTGGDHYIIILDDNLCRDTLNFVVPQPDSIAITFDVDSTGCNAGNDGMATANAIGGQGFYTYNWNTLPPQITQTATDLYAGTFSVTVTDTNNCTGVQEVQVFQPLQLNAITIQDSVSCFGYSDGSATVIPSGGTLPYTYQWSTGQTSSTADNMPAGNNYDVTVTDANGCFIIEPATVLGPAEIVIQTTDVQDAFCFNGDDGEATVMASGDFPPFTYQWNDPASQMTATATGLSAGMYDVIVTDADGCTNSVTVTVGEGDPISMTFTVTDATCWDIADGSATVSATGGVGPYTFLWDDAAMQTDTTATGLITGNYTVAVTDANNCTTTGNIFVPAPPQLDLTISATTTSCPNIDDGTATIVAMGGTPPYSYQWNDPLMQSTDMIFNLVPGTYTVTVTDDSMCQAIDSITVISPNALTILSIDQDSVTCFGTNDGSAEVMLTGGTAPYSFLWSDPLMQFANPANNLFAGTYYVTVMDANNCEVQDSVVVDEPDLLQLDINATDVLCFDEATGTASVVAIGGTLPYSYSWNNMETTATIENLEDATYFVTVTDANGCQQDTSITITEPMTAITTTIGQNLVGCFAASQGVAEVIPMGGTGTNYTYEWSSGATTAIASNLSAEWHYVTVTDEHACEAYDSLLIQEYEEITGNIITIQPTCFGASDGQVGINIVSGGVGSGNISDYTYEWSTDPIQTGDFIQGLLGNTTYTVTITDMDGCTGTVSVMLDDPPLIIANPTITNVSCNGLSDGTITVNPIGVNSFYTYQWGANANNQTTQTAIDLPLGTYSITITDDQDCEMDTMIMITEPDPLFLSLEATVNPCSEDSLGVIVPTVSGGTTPYFYQWSNGQTSTSASGLGNGVYSVTVIDANDCEIVDSIEIATPMPLWAIVSADSVQCFGDANGSITIEPQGGSAPYSYSLDSINYGGASTMIGLTAGYYSVYVQDVNGCVWTIGKEVPSPEEFMVFTAADSLFMELGDSVRLFSSWENGRGFVEMFWTAPYEGTLSCVCPAPWAAPDFTTDYELYGIDEYGCEDTDQLRVVVDKPRGVFVPTGFTPNGDGVNDELFVFGRIGTKVVTYRIYDRWGERVFESVDYLVNDESRAWDGNFRSKPSPAGVYQWMVEVEFLDGITEVFYGHTTLIR